ncbi:MAG: hypothetical protein GY839_10680, partial [candidate division Zixibacteria bacterium]|nr:hypothetical protein [candidate division Zixibacteria bacterium]
MRGYSFGGFKIHPLRFFPASGRVDILTGLTIEVVSGVSNTSFNPTSEFASVVSRFVDNPDLVHKQPVPLSPTDPNDVKYLIITSSALESAFQPLADWYTKTGLPAEIITLTAIQSGYSGSTDQLKIKSCVEDYATNKGTIFVLLGGDDTIIPDQNCWGDVNSGGTTDNTIPTDLFYACHDNTFDWNLDSDSQVGEYSVDG